MTYEYIVGNIKLIELMLMYLFELHDNQIIERGVSYLR